MTVVDPMEILREVDPVAAPADAPPEIANYHEADLHGVACAFCSKFSFTGINSSDIPVGVCDQWEATVEGAHVCDRFASGAPSFDHNGEEVWDVAMSAGMQEPVAYHEIHLAGSVATQGKDGKFRKGILRTGEWDETPTPLGKLPKPLKIVKDGRSDPNAGIISLSEILDNFKSRKPLKRVQIPFADKKNDDHIKDGNLARVNSGFVDDLEIVDMGDGQYELVAACDIRDAKVREGVDQRTLEDVSSGIPFHPQYGAFLEHVCITNTPFIDGLSGWIAASDDAPEGIKHAEVVHHVLPAVETDTDPTAPPEPVEEDDKPKPVALTLTQILERAKAALQTQFGLSNDYTVQDVTPEHALVHHAVSDTTWQVPYTSDDGGFTLAAVADWETIKADAGTPTPPEQVPAPPEPAPAPAPRTTSPEDEVAAAGQLRSMRLAASAQHQTNPTGGANMTVISAEELERLELSDEARAVFQRTLDENARLTATSREATVDSRIEELKGWGFSDRPGFLKLYRQVALGDDGGPAVVLFSDDANAPKETRTAKDILDDAIQALLGSENKVTFSDQHVESGNDNPPPKSDGPDRPVADRAADTRAFLYPHGR